MKFVDLDMAERILNIADNSSSFSEVQDKLLGFIPRQLVIPTLRALEIYYEEKSPSLPRHIRDAWRKYSGVFIRLDRLMNIIDNFCKKYHVDKADFLAWYNGKSVLTRKTEVNGQIFAGTVNFFVLRRLLRKAVKVVCLIGKDIGGSLAKEALFISRRIGASINIKENDFVRIEVIRGEENLGSLSLIVAYSARTDVYLSQNRIIHIVDIPVRPALKIKVFDSSLEKIFYNALLKHNVVVRKDPVLVLGDIIFVPDFELLSKNRRIYVEIVGYWRRPYLVNKEIKIRRALEAGIPIAIIVNSKVLGFFKHLEEKTAIYSFSEKRDLPEIAEKLVSI